jgi:hypothetical protein
MNQLFCHLINIQVQDSCVSKPKFCFFSVSVALSVVGGLHNRLPGVQVAGGHLPGDGAAAELGGPANCGGRSRVAQQPHAPRKMVCLRHQLGFLDPHRAGCYGGGARLGLSLCERWRAADW